MLKYVQDEVELFAYRRYAGLNTVQKFKSIGQAASVCAASGCCI